ncbi:MAG: hypothetical protein NVSMB68_07460 [Thermoanaerobaculia bacterium]
MRPEGLTYRAGFLSPREERDLLENLERLTFHEVRMHGVAARRTVVHLGFDYDYSGWKIVPTDPPPAWLEPLVERCAAGAGIRRERLEQFLVARYPAGASIGGIATRPCSERRSSASPFSRSVRCISA